MPRNMPRDNIKELFYFFKLFYNVEYTIRRNTSKIFRVFCPDKFNFIKFIRDREKYMTSLELRKKFLQFFEKNGHTIAPSSSLLPTDPSVLFTTAGMQQFKPYYLGEKSPWGPNVASIQKCIRTSDIHEVGDERHLTFFEMLGNFSFGGYFKEEAIKLAYEFIVKELKLKIDYVTVFSPDKVSEDDWRKGVAEDTESYEIWKKYVPEQKIRKEGVDNFWGPTGEEGPCGPTTEIYIEGIEIWNIVFNEFFCNKEKKLEKLETPGVDTGMGLERLAMVAQKVSTVFETDLFDGVKSQQERIIADHVRAISFLISDGITPSNKNQGYILRRLIRRILTWDADFHKLFEGVVKKYQPFYSKLNFKNILEVFDKESNIFNLSLREGLKHIKENMAAQEIFSLYETYGLPVDILSDKVKNFNQQEFDELLKKHQELSRTSSAGMFKGGLTDESPETIKLHTAHHLLLAALQHVLGKSVKQRGSNINSERLRIDFSFDRKLTDDEKNKVEEMVNQKIKEGLEVVMREMPIEEAKKIGAEMEFGVKYKDTVSVYFIQDKQSNIFSKEFCGGPHSKGTDKLGKFKIIKEEASSQGVRRIKATLEENRK